KVNILKCYGFVLRGLYLLTPPPVIPVKTGIQTLGSCILDSRSPRTLATPVDGLRGNDKENIKETEEV
ncbi:MAG: hypothetical protein AAB966_05160, partial [Patescibacteria group bacterium]